MTTRQNFLFSALQDTYFSVPLLSRTLSFHALKLFCLDFSDKLLTKIQTWKSSSKIWQSNFLTKSLNILLIHAEITNITWRPYYGGGVLKKFWLFVSVLNWRIAFISTPENHVNEMFSVFVEGGKNTLKERKDHLYYCSFWGIIF